MTLVFHYENGIRLQMKKKNKPRRANIEALIVLLKLSSPVYSVNKYTSVFSKNLLHWMGVLGINKDWMETKYLYIKIRKLIWFFITIPFPI